MLRLGRVHAREVIWQRLWSERSRAVAMVAAARARVATKGTNSMGSNAGRTPSHRLYVYHDDKHYTEVGAVWPHSKGDGFNITIKEGISIGSGSKLTAFKNEPREKGDDRDERDRGRDDDRNGGRRDERRDDRGRR